MLPVLRRLYSRNSLKTVQTVSKQHLSNLCSNLKKNTPLCAMTAAINQQNIRFKMKKSSKIPQQEATESEREEISEDEFFDSVQDKHSKVMKIIVPTLRVDAVVKSALGISRNKIDIMFYENKIRINGEKIPKKNVPVHEGDEVDLIKAWSPTNPDYLNIARVEVLSVTTEEDKIIVKIRRCKSLTVENYGGQNSWKG